MSQPACLLRDLGSAARPPGRILGDELHHQGAHIAGTDPGNGGTGWSRCAHATSGGSPTKGGAPGQAFVSDNSQCIQITGGRGLSSGYPLRRRYSAVPGTIPVTVTGTESITCESPQSVIFTVPLEASRRFPGLISR